MSTDVSNPSHRGYTRWMASLMLRFETNQALLWMLVSKDLRRDEHAQWRANRGNDPVEYTDAIDELVLSIVIDCIAGRMR